MKTTNRLAPTTNGNGHEPAGPVSAMVLGRRDRETIDKIADAIHWAAFHAVEEEPDMTGQDAGKVAAAAEAAAREALRRLLA